MTNLAQNAPFRYAESSVSWGQERRLEFVEFRLLWDGRINRGELVDFFGTSIQQASIDLARYMQLAPGNLEYDKSEKVYKAKSGFTPVFSKPDAMVFLGQLSERPGPSAIPSFIGWRPPHDVVRYPARSIRPEILVRVIWAIRDKQDLELTYQSMRRPVASRRWISPHAVAFDGARWHVRAWCHENGYFKDFVLARIESIHEGRDSEIDGRADRRWHTYTSIVVRARRNLAPGQQLAVATEFGMSEGILRIQLREALVFYFVRLLRLDRAQDHMDGDQVLEIVNDADLLPILNEARSR